MNYAFPSPDEPLDQGDVVTGCPILHVKDFRLQPQVSIEVDYNFRRVIILTPTCDLAKSSFQFVGSWKIVFSFQSAITSRCKPSILPLLHRLPESELWTTGWKPIPLRGGKVDGGGKGDGGSLETTSKFTSVHRYVLHHELDFRSANGFAYRPQNQDAPGAVGRSG